MDTSVFTDKKNIPNTDDLIDKLGNTYQLWQLLADYVHLKYPTALDEWNFSGEKYGWSFRIKDKKRAIIYLLPRDKFFKVAFVFGQKATDSIQQSNVSQLIKVELDAAKVYAEGRGIRIDLVNDNFINDVFELIDIKIAN
jgi:hypothetical protein